MLRPISLAKNNIQFQSEKPEVDKKDSDETRILPNNLKTSVNQGTQKVMSAFIDYPAKGLKGDINSNFYEFLTMGIVPYVLGSGMFMVVFNALNLGKHLGAKDTKAASKMGKKMALGVVLYGVMKSLSQNLVTKPIKAATGIDTEMPYQNKVYNLPKGANENADLQVQWQQRKVFDSKEFYRKDLLDRKYFDKVAKKLGLGENLADSITETSPIIQSTVATSGVAKSISSYCWAAVGVGLAMQDAWPDFFDKVANRTKFNAKKDATFTSKIAERSKIFAKNTVEFTKGLGKACIDSCKQLWQGKPEHTGFMKHSGKALVLFAALTTAVLTTNSIIRAKNMAKNTNTKTIDSTKESTVI